MWSIPFPYTTPASKTNPLATVITMLNGVQKEFETKKAHRSTEIATLDKEHNDQLTDIGIASACPEGEDGCRVEIATPDSIIGLLEKKRNQSIDKENADTVAKNADQVSLQDNDKTLYGEDGKGGLVGAFSKLQPGCDYWMVNGPGRFEEIAAERCGLSFKCFHELAQFGLFIVAIKPIGAGVLFFGNNDRRWERIAEKIAYEFGRPRRCDNLV